MAVKMGNHMRTVTATNGRLSELVGYLSSVLLISTGGVIFARLMCVCAVTVFRGYNDHLG